MAVSSQTPPATWSRPIPVNIVIISLDSEEFWDCLMIVLLMSPRLLELAIIGEMMETES